MSTLPYLDYLLHFSMEMMMKSERVQGIHVIQRVQIVIKFWHKDTDIRKMGELSEGCRPTGCGCIVHYTCD
jgi:hypothetical protein